MILTDEELFALTRRRRSDAQVRVLRGLGIVHRQRPDGSVAVARAHVEALLGVTKENTMKNEIEPNWGAV